MIKLAYNQLEALAKNQLCAEHGTPVGVAWHAQEDCWTLRCGEGHYPDALARILTLTELYKSGEELPLPIANNIERRLKQKAMTQEKQTQDPRFALVPQVDLGTGELLLPETVKLLVTYAQKYDLDPFRSHVALMYGKPYITLDGYLYHAKRENIPYELSSRPLDDQERSQYIVGEGDHAWIATVEILEPGGYFTGQGIVTKEEMTAKSKKDTTKLASPVVASHPWQLAQKRAEWQALRRAFPIGETEETKEE